MRSVLRRDLSPEQAVQEYHQLLNGQALIARRTLEEDLAITESVLSQG
jgi:hypothetical protein